MALGKALMKKDKKKALDKNNQINACALQAVQSGKYKSIEDAKDTVCNPESFYYKKHGKFPTITKGKQSSDAKK